MNKEEAIKGLKETLFNADYGLISISDFQRDALEYATDFLESAEEVKQINK